MASSFAAQLRSIAQNSTHELDLRARRTAHTESLLFSKEVAAKQDFDTIFAICVEGFRELCSLDATFIEFERNLFSTQSVRMEREQMSKSDNEALDKVLERCLAMLGGKALLKPGVRCMEWLVRRFRVHVNNMAALLMSVLPWHEMSIWRNVMSIVPKEECTGVWKFLGLYKEEALNVPRNAIVYAMTNTDGFFSLLNRYVVETSKDGTTHAGMLKFWTGVVVEAVVGKLDAAKSGRKEIQRQRTEDLLLKVLPLLSDAFEVRAFPDLTLACFTLAMVLAGKADLDDRVLDSLLQAVATAAQYPETETRAALVTMVVILGQKQSKSIPKVALEVCMNLSNLEAMLMKLSKVYQIEFMVGALVNGALSSIKKKNVESRLSFVERVLLSGNTLPQSIVTTAAQAVLARLFDLRSDHELESIVRAKLIAMLQRLNGEHSLSLAMSEASKRLNQDSSQLEALLGSTVTAIEDKTDLTADAMEVDLPIVVSANYEEVLKKVPSRTVDTVSFLAKHDRHLYDQLIECFVACCNSTSSLQRFVALSIWKSSQADDLLLTSLLLRVAIGPFTSSQKSAALRLLAQSLSQAESAVDCQALLSYTLTALSDPVQSVRRSAADLLITIERIAPADNDSTKRWGSDHLYDQSVMEAVKWIAGGQFKKIVGQAFLPHLEEAVLDASQIARAVDLALNGSEAGIQTPIKSNQLELKKSLRHDLFDLLTSHAVATPLFKIKVNAIHFLKEVYKVGTSTKSKALAPLLKAWSSLDEAAAQQLADDERLILSDIDAAMIEIVSAQDKDAVGRVLTMLEDKDAILRADLVAAFFSRVQRLWQQLKYDSQVANAQKIFGMAFQDNTILARGSQSVLRSVALATPILGTLLDQSTGGINQIYHEEQHPKKKRRTSQGRDSLPPDLARVVKATSSQLTFALELVDESKPEMRPELLPALFDTLSTLKRLKQQQRTNLPYLHNLCLSSILAIVDAQRVLVKPTIDISSIRADLVTDCILSSENSQVQTAALLLSASLASVAPDRILHNIMPIFTFVGANMFEKNDDYSMHVVNQAIDTIIPALVTSLRNQNKDLIKSTSSLLASFTAAFDHISQHRRVAVYTRLLIRMGAQDFAFVVFAMLGQRKGHHISFHTFFHDLLGELDAETQLLTFQKIIYLANDIVAPKPQLAEDIFGVTESLSKLERQGLSKTTFNVALNILKSKTLKARASRFHKLNVNVAEKLRSEIHTSFGLVLATIRDRRRDGSDVIEEAKQCLDALLALPSLIELFRILPQTLTSEEVDDDLKPQALRVLAMQLKTSPLRDSKTRTAAMELLGRLTEVLQGDLNVAMKQAIIVCIDRLSEVYGRKDIEAVVSAASIVASDQCLGSEDRRLEMMSLLCLASMLEVLKEACIPIVPEMMSKVIKILRDTAQGDAEDEELHTAALALTAAVASHVPFLLSDENLQALLVLSSFSVAKYTSIPAIDSRTETLTTIARKVDLASLLAALAGEDLEVVREYPEDAELEKLNMLSVAIEAATKVNVGKNADAISQLLLAHLDQRSRLLSKANLTGEDIIQAVSDVEGEINAISIQFVYKLNDTAFRPIFEAWIDWASNAYDIEDPSLREAMKPLRQNSMFGLLAHFFETLKSIVTSYASYLIPMSHEILSSIALLAESKKSSHFSVNVSFYSAFLSMLKSTFTHDADAFYSTPSHFEPIASPLISQLNLASSKALRSIVYTSIIPTIVSLATATLDTPSHHQTLSRGLVRLRHSSSAAVRLASIKTFAAMTANENVSEDFIANVIGIGSGEGEGARGVGGGGSVGEVMIYVNEMLEDDDEEVEREVRRWVQVVREKTGEDVFEV